MWLWMSVCSALLLGIYDVAKKQALKRNGVYWILFSATALTALFLAPCLSPGSLADHLCLMLKALLVSASWVSGLVALQHLPLTTVSTVKASRPMFVVVFSILLFGERLNLPQWLGVAIVMTALFLSTRSKRREGGRAAGGKGMPALIVSVLTGAASALYDKYILQHLEPLFVQSWSNVYITALLAIVMLVQYLSDREHFRGFAWDWRILLIAVLITASDMLYFFAVKEPGALLSVISMIRRSSVVITFLFGALMFREGHVRDKALDMVLMMAGIALLLFGSS